MQIKKNRDFIDWVKKEGIKPIFVSANHVNMVILGPKMSTWAYWRTTNMGPKYYKVHGSIYYKIAELEAYFSQNPSY